MPLSPPVIPLRVDGVSKGKNERDIVQIQSGRFTCESVGMLRCTASQVFVAIDMGHGAKCSQLSQIARCGGKKVSANDSK